jgi:hypothetical protein
LGHQKLFKNERISVLGNMPIELIKRKKGGLGNLTISPRLKSRNGGEPSGIIKEVNTKTLPFSFNASTYKPWV